MVYIGFKEVEEPENKANEIRDTLISAVFETVSIDHTISQDSNNYKEDNLKVRYIDLEKEVQCVCDCQFDALKNRNKRRTLFMKSRKVSALVMAAVLLVLSVCGNNSGINVKSQDTVEENVKDRISDNSDASSNAGDAENVQLGGVSFEIIDSDTLKALINDPYILARATDMMQIQLKLFPDEAARDRFEGSFAFKMAFYGEGEHRDCNVYPQTCRWESDGEGSRIIDEEIIDSNGAQTVGGGIADDTKIWLMQRLRRYISLHKPNSYMR